MAIDLSILCCGLRAHLKGTPRLVRIRRQDSLQERDGQRHADLRQFVRQAAELIVGGCEVISRHRKFGASDDLAASGWSLMRLLWQVRHRMLITSRVMIPALGMSGVQHLMLIVIGRHRGIQICELAKLHFLDKSTLTEVITRWNRKACSVCALICRIEGVVGYF